MVKERYIYVYQTINLVNGKSYIGVHSTTKLNDGYIGCGICKQSDAFKDKYSFHRAVNKYGYASFKRHILSFYDTYEEALEEERYLVNKEWVKRNDNYNNALGGNSGTVYFLSADKKKDMYLKIANKNRGKKRSKSFCENISEKKRGVKLSKSHIEALKKNNARYWKGKKMHPSVGEAVSLAKKGVPISDEQKRKLSIIKMGKPSNNRKPIIQYSVDSVKIREFNSGEEAAKILGCLKTSINNNLRGISKSCKNFIFKYK